jgi:hypothetical protein
MKDNYWATSNLIQVIDPMNKLEEHELVELKTALEKNMGKKIVIMR